MTLMSDYVATELLGLTATDEMGISLDKTTMLIVESIFSESS